ncbi:MAG: porin family protein [Prevotella sp.]
MKKIVFLLIAAFITVSSSTAQTWRQSSNSNNNRDSWQYDNQFYYGLRLGLAVSTINSDDARLDAPGSRSGLNLGAVFGYELSSGLPVFLESGLFYTEKGGKYTKQGCNLKYNLNYLKLPIVVKYNIELDDPFCITPFAGGYLAYGISGKIKDYTTRESIKAFSDFNFKRFDGGLTIGCGFSYQIVYAELSYDFGLSNNSQDEFGSCHNGTLNLNFGVNF